MHFENIWNESEKLSSQLEDNSLENIIKILHFRIDNLIGCVNLPKDQALNIGEILFELARIAQITEKNSTKSVNVAAGMRQALESRKEELLDKE